MTATRVTLQGADRKTGRKRGKDQEPAAREQAHRHGMVRSQQQTAEQPRGTGTAPGNAQELDQQAEADDQRYLALLFLPCLHRPNTCLG